MTNIPVIGVAGRARSGKDTLVNFIMAARGFGYRYAFADPIKRMLLALNIDCTDPFWVDNKEKEIPALGVSLRRLLQTLGTEWGRQLIHPDLWVILAKQALFDNGPGMLIPDVRFENEASWIRSVGGRVIHIQRPDATPVEGHVSESGIARAPEDIVLINNGTLEDLQHVVQEMFHG